MSVNDPFVRRRGLRRPRAKTCTHVVVALIVFLGVVAQAAEAAAPATQGCAPDGTYFIGDAYVACVR